MMDGKRELWLDAAKGLAMILVVAGHSHNPNSLITYIYWFHMPVFFLFSGYVSKPISQWSQVGPYLKKRAQSLLIPYIGYLGIFTVIRYLEELINGNFSWSWYIKDMGMLLFGGRFITGYYGVFWFITCLFFTQVLFLMIFLIFKNTKVRLLFIFFLYVLSHIEAWYIHTLNGSVPSLHVFIPWNLDVSMLALFYYSIGYYLKPYLKKLPPLLTVSCLLLISGLLTLQGLGLLHYHLNMKYLIYDDLTLDALIPIIITIAFCGTLQMIHSIKILSLLSFINYRCFAIMYMHKAINELLLRIVHYGNVIYTVAGVIIPLLISMFIIEKKFHIKNFLLHLFQFQSRHSGKSMNK